ncbi:hypothetical protein GCM10023185_30720 [Hymenobacter saemangeumensis]|uniref:Uncharacterized protein n=1 Tax=Hymenobacter saemangeumensis TaxID=1084522 RepID=A0ABP8ILP8_9BACT
MKKIISALLLLSLLFSLLAVEGCAQRSSLQKKTKMYKRRSAGGNVPCPCDSH